MEFWKNLRLSSRFMIFAAVGVIVMVTGVVVGIVRFERQEIERQLELISANEMTSLHALILNVMTLRPEDNDNIGIQVFNRWFGSRNDHYPGKVWSVWGPKVVKFMHETEPDHQPKLPQDAVDEEALATGQTIKRFVNGAYRYAYPIVLGVTSGAEAEVCHACHGAMEMEDGEVIAVLSSSLSTADADQRLREIVIFMVLGGILGTLFSVFAIRAILRRIIVRPLDDMTQRMQGLAQGDTSIEVPNLDRKDEIGDIARAVQIFKENTQAKQSMEEQAKQETATREARMRNLEGLIANFDRTVSEVLSTVGDAANQMLQTTQGLVQTADGASERARSAAGQATEASTNVQQVAESADQLTQASNDIAQQVAMSTEVAVNAAQEADSVDKRVTELASVAEKIGEVIGLITGIAEQTNLLALNATIEAARAGDAGKGFAVVAAEVKNLANQTVRATEEISAQVATIQSETQQTVTAIRGINRTIASMDEITSVISSAVQRQGDATRDIAGNIEEAARGTQQVNDNILEVSQAIHQADEAAKNVLGGIQKLQSLSDKLRGDVDAFLKAIRDA